MQDKLLQLIDLAMSRQATDVHFTLHNGRLKAQLRGRNGMEEIHSAILDVGLFHYLKYMADLDLGNADHPQSGSFHLRYGGKTLAFRFSLISAYGMQTGVLRILNNHAAIALRDLSSDPNQYAQFASWTRLRSGMVILSGPTGSGKTTTLYALLDAIAKQGRAKIMTLEDPIEMHDERFVQVAINEAGGFTYEEGIRQFMRHDPDVILIGEIRDTITAKMAYRCALTGHMVFSSVHAKSAQEALKRLSELGLQRKELCDTLSAVCAQRLYPHKVKEKERVCIYEILEGKALADVLLQKPVAQHADIYVKIREAVSKGIVSSAAAAADLYAETL